MKTNPTKPPEKLNLPVFQYPLSHSLCSHYYVTEGAELWQEGGDKALAYYEIASPSANGSVIPVLRHWDAGANGYNQQTMLRRHKIQQQNNTMEHVLCEASTLRLISNTKLNGGRCSLLLIPGKNL